MIEVAAAALLVLLATIRLGPRGPTPDGSRPSCRWVPWAFMLGLAGAVAAHHWLVRPPDTVVDAESTRLVEHARPRLLQALDDPRTHLLVVVNGASLTARGVDGQARASRLRRETGLQVAVIQLSLAGANHIERQAIARSLVNGLDRDARRQLSSIPMVVLWEVHRGYDNELLAMLEENRGTARAFAYLDPAGAMTWLRAAASSERPALREQALGLAPVVAWHAGVSVLRIGSSHWFTPAAAVEPLPGFNPETRLQETARVVGLAANVDRMEAIESPGAPLYIDSHLLPDYVGSFGNPRAQVVFFSPPSRHVGHLAYVQQFCSDHRQRVCIGFRNRALLDRLDHRRYWVDGSHLSPPGAAIYTRWLAGVLGGAVIRHDLARQRDDYG
ncbi:hypothetical protein [Lysobacter sp. A3-1-A15]|uniref:hypothetical protein n=1 Tax=Novilysobacter viscosus TaxID=3098602 RepID=UPI002ED9682E